MRTPWLHQLDSYANETYGRTVSEAVGEQTCVRCNEPVDAFNTRSAADCYTRVGLCQRCQRTSSSSGVVVAFKPRETRSPRLA